MYRKIKLEPVALEEGSVFRAFLENHEGSLCVWKLRCGMKIYLQSHSIPSKDYPLPIFPGMP